MPKKSKKNVKRTAALEISHSGLDLVLVQEADNEGPPEIRTRTVTWRKEAPSLNTETGVQELSSALKILVAEEKMSGVPLYIALNGDFCVTRVVAGTAEKVRHELRQLEERTNLYLSLGAGEKSLAGHVRQVDVRHQHGWLAVTNARTLESVLAAADAAGVAPELMEPSLVSRCRAVSAMGGDAEEPALVVAVDERGVELGISYQGRLLLDYRPGGRQAKDDIASTVKHHLERLQRYCDRHFGYAGGQITRLFLCGETEAVQGIRDELADFDRLEIVMAKPEMVCPDWIMEEVEEGSELISALGAVLAHGLPTSERNGPNLLERTQAGLREPLLRGLLVAAWPIAATILIACGFVAASFHERGKCSQLQAGLDSMQGEKDRYKVLQVQYTTTGKKLRHMQTLKAGLKQQAPQHLVTLVGQCLPNDVWIEQLSIASKGRLSINGSTYTEEGLYEFVSHLRKIPHLSQVALEGTTPGNARGGPSTLFSISCQLADHNDYSGGAE